MNLSLQNQIALVTGASSGLGRAAAKGLAAASAIVVVNYPPHEDGTNAAAVVDDIKKEGGEAIAIAADVSNENDVTRMFADIVARYGTLHIAVSNAGIERPSAIADMTFETWKAVLDVNLNGAFFISRAATREFLRRGPVPNISRATGKIIFTSSVHEIIPWAFQSNYAASKGALSMFTKTLAQELAPRRIRVNAVAPGAIRTPINTQAWETKEALDELLKLIPYGRIGEPEDVANAIVWLASDLSDYVTGHSLLIDGGMALYAAFRGAG
jgi:glucose 1-dehydrogenase